MSCQLDEDAEDDRRNHAGDAEAGIHDPAGRARIGPSDVQGQRPQHRVGQLKEEERGGKETHGGKRALGDDGREQKHKVMSRRLRELSRA